MKPFILLAIVVLVVLLIAVVKKLNEQLTKEYKIALYLALHCTLCIGSLWASLYIFW